MSLNPNTLMQSVYDFFNDNYNATNHDANVKTFFCFEGIGQPLFESDFKINASDPNYSEAVALEKFSEIVNTIPLLDSQKYIPTGNKIEEFYEILVNGMLPSLASNDNATFFEMEKSLALKRMMNTVGSMNGEGMPFRRSFPTPKNWYDKNLRSSWAVHTFNSGNVKQNDNSNYFKLKSPLLNQNLSESLWKISPDIVISNAILQRFSPLEEVKTAVVEEPLPLILNFNAFENSPVKSFNSNENLNFQKQQGNLKLTFLNASILKKINTESIVTELLPIERLNLPVEQPDISEIHSKLLSASINESLLNSDYRKISMSERFSVNRFVFDNSTPIDTPTESFSITFNYCYVQIDRPWIYSPLLYQKRWYIPSFYAGELSTGFLDTTNVGLFPALPIAFIVISDLSISGTWSNTDVETINNSNSFGPFSLIDKTFNDNKTSLNCSGMQIVGWINQLMPKCPDFPDPSLPIIIETEVLFYEGQNFTGKSYRLGKNAFATLDGTNIPDESINSIKIPDGLKVVLFQHKNFAGSQLPLTKSVSSLGTNQFANKMSSVYVTDASDDKIPTVDAPQVTFYEGVDYNGGGYPLGKGQFANVLEGSGVPNDAINAISIPPGFKVILFQHWHFEGKQLVLTESSPNLGKFSFGSILSSVFITDITDETKPVFLPLQVTFYEGENYNGLSHTLGKGAYSVLDGTGIPNDLINSISIPFGLKVVLFENWHYEGQQLVLNEPIPSLGTKQFANILSSIYITDVTDNTIPVMPTPVITQPNDFQLQNFLNIPFLGNINLFANRRTENN